jgi:hypothetical protein
MTRQPSAEKRFTVACPMPRLAPVRTIVFFKIKFQFYCNASTIIEHNIPSAAINIRRMWQL